MTSYIYDGQDARVSKATVSGLTLPLTESAQGLDYFGASYYTGNMGRIMSPDWVAKEEPVPYAQMDDP